MDVPTEYECLKALCDYRGQGVNSVSASDLRKWRMKMHPDKGGSDEQFRYSNSCHRILHDRLNREDAICPRQAASEWYNDMNPYTYNINFYIPFPRFGSIVNINGQAHVLSIDNAWNVNTRLYRQLGAEEDVITPANGDAFESTRVSAIRNVALYNLLMNTIVEGIKIS